MKNELKEAQDQGKIVFEELLKILKGVNGLLPIVLLLYLEKVTASESTPNIWKMMNPQGKDTDNELIGILNSIAPGLGTTCKDLRDANSSQIVDPIDIFSFFFLHHYEDLKGMTPYQFIQDHTQQDRMKKVRMCAVHFQNHTSI